METIAESPIKSPNEQNTIHEKPFAEDGVEAITNVITVLEINPETNGSKSILQLTPLTPTEIKKQHLSRSLSDVSINSDKDSHVSSIDQRSSKNVTPKRASVPRIHVYRPKSKSDSNIELDGLQINSPSVHDHGQDTARKAASGSGSMHTSLPTLFALKSAEKNALRNSAPPSLAPESRRSSPQLKPNNVTKIVDEHTSASGMSKTHSTGRRSFIHRLFHPEDRTDEASVHSTQRNGHHSSAESDSSAHGSEDQESHNKFVPEEEIAANAPAAFPSKKHRFHLDHLFRDLLHNKLHSPGSIFGSNGSIASSAPSRSSSRNSMAGHSDDEGEHSNENLDELDETNTEAKHVEDREKKHHHTTVKNRARAESSSTGRKRSNLTSAFRQLMMPAKHSTRAAKAAEAEAGFLPPDLLLEQKYGSCGRVLGKGAGGVVRMCQMMTTQGQKFNKVYAVKEFKKRKNETEREHVKVSLVTSEPS